MLLTPLKIHIDEYKLRLYRGLAQSTENIPPEESMALCGFNFGNGRHDGCLTTDPNVKLHTCELGMDCPALKPGQTVHVTPVVTRSNDGFEIQEIGAATGTGDLELAHEIDLNDIDIAKGLIKLCAEHLGDTKASREVVELISKAANSGKKTLPIPSAGLPEDLDDLTITQIIELIVKTTESQKSAEGSAGSQDKKRPRSAPERELPNRIVSRMARLCNPQAKYLADISIF